MTVWAQMLVVKHLNRKADSTSDTCAPPVTRPVALASLVQNKLERSHPMFTPTVEVTTKSGKGRELANTINDKVLPILKNKPDSLMRPFWYRMPNPIAFWH